MQVVLNLLNNAMEAFDGTGIQTPTIDVSCTVQGDQVVLRVHHNGPGIDPASQEEVFALFKSSRAQGMGVGLWLSRSIVLAHEGELAFDSLPGEQTVFTKRIPFLGTQTVH